MQRALLAAILLAPLCALLGVFVTARGLAFFSDTISHGALAGIALGFWWGLADPTLPMVLFSLLVAGALLWLQRHTRLSTDTILALLLSGSVSLGVVILSLLQSYRGELHRYLFGDILAVGSREVWLAVVLVAVVGAGVLYHLSSFTLLTAQEEMAHVCGVSVRRLNFLFVLALTVTVALSIRLLGIVLVTSLLVIPPATARNLSRSFRQQIWLSLAAGLVAGFLGIVFSYQFNVPSGPTIVLTGIGLFCLTLVVASVRATPRARGSGG